MNSDISLKIQDIWVDELGQKSLDVSQDWILVSGKENSTHTSLEFRRHYVTCDENDDLEIYENHFEVSNLVYAYSYLDANSFETIGEPAVESVTNLGLFDRSETFEPKETDIEILDNWLNVSLIIFNY